MGLCNSIFLCSNVDVKFYRPIELETKCNLAIIRIEARHRTSKNMFRKQRNDIKEHLLNDDVGMAFDVAERVALDEYTRKAEKVLKHSCTYVGRNYGVIANGGQLDEKMKKMLFTLVWAAPRLQVSELHWIRRAVTEWYGEDMDTRILANSDNYVNSNVIELLGTSVPKEDSVLYIINSVCGELGIKPPLDPDNVGKSGVMTTASPLQHGQQKEVVYEADDECDIDDDDEPVTERCEKDEWPEELHEDEADWISTFRKHTEEGTHSLVISENPVTSIVDDTKKKRSVK